MELQKVYLHIAHERYHFLKFILEGYDGLCLLSTVPGVKGCVCIRYPKNSSNTLFALLGNISKTISTEKSVRPA